MLIICYEIKQNELVNLQIELDFGSADSDFSFWIPQGELPESKKAITGQF